ncbi:MAG: Spo0B domain-containing protein [Firmicutes bacterium]|nr:Spo0B domain-containing protein [Bacillota bacterium]
MDDARLMKLISLQRHDFLNDFQVVSGLLQLDRAEQARKYLNNAVRKMINLSGVMHLRATEAAAILLAYYSALERGVGVRYEVQADLGGCAVPAEKLAPVLEAILFYSVECLALPENKDRLMEVFIHTADGGYLFGVRYKTAAVPGTVDDVLRDIGDELLLYGASLKQSQVDGQTEIFLFLPAV